MQSYLKDISLKEASILQRQAILTLSQKNQKVLNYFTDQKLDVDTSLPLAIYLTVNQSISAQKYYALIRYIRIPFGKLEL